MDVSDHDVEPVNGGARAAVPARIVMKFTDNHTLEQILESAIVASWEGLTNGASPERIHIEYNFTAGGTVDDLRIWSSIARGH